MNNPSNFLSHIQLPNKNCSFVRFNSVKWIDDDAICVPETTYCYGLLLKRIFSTQSSCLWSVSRPFRKLTQHMLFEVETPVPVNSINSFVWFNKIRGFRMQLTSNMQMLKGRMNTLWTGGLQTFTFWVLWRHKLYNYIVNKPNCCSYIVCTIYYTFGDKSFCLLSNNGKN